MTQKSYKRYWQVEVGQFHKKIKPSKYNGTWWWNAGYTDNLMPSFPIFMVEESSHGYVKGQLGKARKGPIIKTKAEAMRIGTIAMKKHQARIADEAKKTHKAQSQ